MTEKRSFSGTDLLSVVPSLRSSCAGSKRASKVVLSQPTGVSIPGAVTFAQAASDALLGVAPGRRLSGLIGAPTLPGWLALFASTPTLLCQALGSDFFAVIFALEPESLDGSQLSALQSIDSVSGDARTPLAGTFSACDDRNPRFSDSATAGAAQSDKAEIKKRMRFDGCMGVIR